VPSKLLPIDVISSFSFSRAKPCALPPTPNG
jgi:hypothetical protein